ncbi:hypothetical protein JCM10908_002051 [Rhodotorula pacifica]|uniref:uncharacterized protein n=1 Tax=Rhodotorula pacifica TaxID=1495444 RepID=UPI00317AA163
MDALAASVQAVMQLNGDLRRDRALRAAALRQPLRAGHVLAPLAKLASDHTLASAVPTQHEASGGVGDEESRQPIPFLRDLAYTVEEWRTLRFELVRELAGGEGRFAQTWLATAKTSNSDTTARVVVKLLAEELFPHGWGRNGVPDRTAKQSEEAELMAALQGISVPYCYGAYEFQMPWGRMVTGFVLEDLTEVGTHLRDYCEAEAEALSTVEAIAPLGESIFELVHLIQQHGVARLAWESTDIFVVNSPSRLSAPGLAICNFGVARPVEQVERERPQADAGSLTWSGLDEHYAHASLECAASSVAQDWLNSLCKAHPHQYALFAPSLYYASPQYDEDLLAAEQAHERELEALYANSD